MKPSEWIKQRAEELDAGKGNPEVMVVQALIDMLDRMMEFEAVDLEERELTPEDTTVDVPSADEA